MIFTSEEELPNKTNKQQSIFLAGSMDTKLSNNWRIPVMDIYFEEYNFFDPTNRNYEKLNILSSQGKDAYIHSFCKLGTVHNLFD